MVANTNPVASHCFLFGCMRIGIDVSGERIHGRLDPPEDAANKGPGFSNCFSHGAQYSSGSRAGGSTGVLASWLVKSQFSTRSLAYACIHNAPSTYSPGFGRHCESNNFSATYTGSVKSVSWRTSVTSTLQTGMP